MKALIAWAKLVTGATPFVYYMFLSIRNCDPAPSAVLILTRRVGPDHRHDIFR